MLLFAQGVVGQRQDVNEEDQSLLLIRHETDRQPLPNRMANDSSRQDGVVVRLAPLQRCELQSIGDPPERLGQLFGKAESLCALFQFMQVLLGLVEMTDLE